MSRFKEKKKSKKYGWIIALVVLIVVVIGGAKFYISDSMKAVDSKNSKSVEVYIKSGSSNDQIIKTLQKKNLIKSSIVFKYYAKSNVKTGFKAGYYSLNKSMNVKTIAKNLEKGGSATPVSGVGKLVVQEGATADQIATAVQKSTKYSSKEFMALIQDQSFLDELAKEYPDLLGSAMSATDVRYKLEGYLFPATYDTKNVTSLKALVTQMVATTNTQLSPYFATIKSKGYSVQEVMTLASLVEREGVTNTDRKKIAGVFFNRIDKDMPLQSDISVMYALNTHKKNLTYADLKVDSPYNLYVENGYGPGPFNSPSLQSILAVLNPLDRSKNYLYFIANMKTGKVYYAKTYAQHQKLTDKLADYNK
ncbi:endolytic transglycosylase MltG [Paucilactobacillus nenjiangensis]|uniref:endolytic transglycosylase MltG n=1 Tax=Paucilactobacillus nenjiangensis TaxID=1296540 RepID=UPI003FA1D973